MCIFSVKLSNYMPHFLYENISTKPRLFWDKPIKCKNCRSFCLLPHFEEKPLKCNVHDYQLQHNYITVKHSRNIEIIRLYKKAPSLNHAEIHISYKKCIFLGLRRPNSEKPFICTECDYVCKTQHEKKNVTLDYKWKPYLVMFTTTRGG